MTPSWDMFTILFFVIMTVYGLLLGRGRVFNILINTYVGLVIAGELGALAFTYLAQANNLSHSFSMSLFGAKLLVFAGVVFILTLNKELSGAQDDANASSLYTATYGFLSAGLMLSSVFSFMGASERLSLFTASDLAAKVYDYRILWLVAPILVIIASNVLNRLARH